VGFFEFSLMRVNAEVPQEKLARALDAYIHGDPAFAQEVFGHPTVIGRALVHESALAPELESEILDWERASAIVRDARRIAVSLCYCRHKAAHLGKACAAPLENCLSLDSGAEFVIRRGFGREIERGEALEILAQAREHKLVHIGDNVQRQPSYICSCCGCCCDQLMGIKLWGLAAVNPSRFQARSSEERCSGCLLCVRTCPIGAIGSVPKAPPTPGRKPVERAIVDAEKCIGCGVCMQACHRGAMHLEARPRVPSVPQDAVEKAIRIALEHGRLAHLVFDEGASRGHRALNRMLSALLALPPISRALADEQLRSRFVRFALSRVPDPTA
jgi:ferredoxin